MIIVLFVANFNTAARADFAPHKHSKDTDCQSCHQSQWQSWNGSDHKKSMMVATKNSVLGNFDDQITLHGITTRFYKKDNEFWVNSDNKDGINEDFKIEYTFGFKPLQQYLIKTTNGKYQVLPLAWDSRDQEHGGQRWFHIYGDDHVPFNDRLHWSQPLQNWNGMCADCHSTGFKRKFEPKTNQFKSIWETDNVSCASCHNADTLKTSVHNDFAWIMEDGKNTATWSGENRDQSEIEVCAACHSRRSPLSDGFKANDKFLDAFSPSPILMPDYFADGQIREEDYVWGSFLQSKMYSKGVICTDCHDPHSLKLKASGNELCGQCHLPQHFDNPEHHHHPVGSTGGLCINCHMTERTYMGVDDRADHSFRIPRPDLNHKTNSPDACTSCHKDQQPLWAAAHLKNWFGEKQNQKIHYGEILNDVFKGEPNAPQNLKALLLDSQIPAIIRGSAFVLLANYPNLDTLDHIKKGLASVHPLIRLGAVRATSFVAPLERGILLEKLLNDDYRAIRVEAVRLLADVPINQMSDTYKRAYQDAEKEFITAQNQTGWRGEGAFNLGLFYSGQAKMDLAQQQYLSAITIDPYFPASYINLADIFREQNNEMQSHDMIDRGLSVLPENADLNFAKALSLVRDKNTNQALSYLSKAVTLAPSNAYYAYVYAVALNDLGQRDKAEQVLKSALELSVNDANLNMMLLNHYSSKGHWAEALKYAQKLNALFPDNQMIKDALSNLKNKLDQ